MIELRLRGADGSNDRIREVERESIRGFVAEQAELYEGKRVLDFGAGRQQYRDVIEQAGGEYHAFDRVIFPGSICEVDVGPEDWRGGWWDVILCTQVLQYQRPDELVRFVQRFATTLHKSRGHLVLTYGTCWPEVEDADLLRLTRHGINWLLDYGGFQMVKHERRASVDLNGCVLPLGGGVVARV